MCLNKPRLLMSQNIKNIDKHQFRGNFADFFGTSIAGLEKTSYLCIVFERMLFIISFH